MSSALPPIDQALIPADVRAEGSKAVQLYDTALSFEGVLDQQLTQSLTDTLDPSSSDSDGSDDGSSPDAATSLMMQMLPQQLSQALVSNGGLGLASQLYQALGGTTATPASGAGQTTAAPGAAASSSTGGTRS
jgi:Rod binding domain-containing protein